MKDENFNVLNMEDDESQNVYLTFDIAGETYAVNIQSVTTIVGMQHISEMPDLPPYVKGAMNLRGKVIPVMDLRLRFGLPWQAYDDRTTIIVLNINETSTGLVVDKVTDVVTLPPDKIAPPPHWQTDGKKGVILGLGKLEKQVCIILDIGHLLFDKEISIDLSRAGEPDSVKA